MAEIPKTQENSAAKPEWDTRIYSAIVPAQITQQSSAADAPGDDVITVFGIPTELAGAQVFIPTDEYEPLLTVPATSDPIAAAIQLRDLGFADYLPLDKLPGNIVHYDAFDAFKVLLQRFPTIMEEAVCQAEKKGFDRSWLGRERLVEIVKKYRAEAAVASGLTGDPWYSGSLGSPCDVGINFGQVVIKNADGSYNTRNQDFIIQRNFLQDQNGQKRTGYGLVNCMGPFV